VAIAMCEGPEQGLRLIDDLLAREHLANYHLAHSARADLCRRLGRIPEARASYQKALALLAPGNDRQETDRRFLARRLQELNQE
jgi:RNA polymerase sigma-70 factor (ECF subfamily)